MNLIFFLNCHENFPKIYLILQILQIHHFPNTFHSFGKILWMKISKLINLSIISYLWFQNVKEETVIIFWKPLVFRVLKLIEIFIEFNLPYSLDWLIWKNCILNKSYHSNFQFYHQQKKSQNNDWITNWKLLFLGGF